MRSKILFACSIIIMGLAIVLNFNEMLMGLPASLLNVIVTICFLFFWIAFLALARKNKGLLIYSSAISGITLIIALLTLVINVYDWTIPNAIPLVAIFLTPFYGIRSVFDKGFILSSIIMAFICAIWLISSIVLQKRTK